MKHNDKLIPNIYYTPEEAFFHNKSTNTPPKFTDIIKHMYDENKLPAGFKISQIDSSTTLTIFSDGITLIIPNIALEIVHTVSKIYGIEPQLNKPFTISWGSYDDHFKANSDYYLVIVLFNSYIVLDNKFVVEEVEPMVYKIQHSLYPDKYVHNVKCNFANLMITYHEQTTF